MMVDIYVCAVSGELIGMQCDVTTKLPCLPSLNWDVSYAVYVCVKLPLPLLYRNADLLK